MDFELINGECINEMNKLAKNGMKFDLVLTDPPYGTTACNWDSIIPLKSMWNCLDKLTYDKTPIVLFSNQPFTSRLVDSKIQWYRCEWIYQKKTGTNFATYKYQPSKIHENVIVFSKKSPNYYPIKEKKKESSIKRDKYVRNASGRKIESNNLKEYSTYPTRNSMYKYPSTIRKINNLKTEDRGLHPTQKPIELMEYFIKTYSRKGDVVLDFTMGSGTTGVACANTGRNFVGIELDKKYFDIAKERINSYNILNYL